MAKSLGTSNVGGDLIIETRASGGSLDERVRFTGAGQVLINATTDFAPATKLQVRGASSAISDGGQIFDVASTATATGGTRLAFGVKEDDYTWIRSYESGVGARDLVFAVSSERVRIKADGKVGINQGSSYAPLTSLDIRHPDGTAGTGTKQSLVTICAGRNSARGLEIKTGHPTTGNQNDAGVYYNAKDTESSAYHAQHVWQLGGNNAMVLGNTGNHRLGIGEEFPSYPLDIAYTNNTAWQNGEIGNGIEVHNKSTTAGTSAGIHLYATGNGANAAASHITCVHTANGTGDLSFANRHAAGGHSERMRLRSDGILKVPQGVDQQSNAGSGHYTPYGVGFIGSQWTTWGPLFPMFYLGEYASSSGSTTVHAFDMYASHHWGDFPRCVIMSHMRYYEVGQNTWTFGCYGGSSHSGVLTLVNSWGSYTAGHNGGAHKAGVTVTRTNNVAVYSGVNVHRWKVELTTGGAHLYQKFYVGFMGTGARGIYASDTSESTVTAACSGGGCVHMRSINQTQFRNCSYLS